MPNFYNPVPPHVSTNYASKDIPCILSDNVDSASLASYNTKQYNMLSDTMNNIDAPIREYSFIIPFIYFCSILILCCVINWFYSPTHNVDYSIKNTVLINAYHEMHPAQKISRL